MARLAALVQRWNDGDREALDEVVELVALERPAPPDRPDLEEALWKLALVGGLLTALLAKRLSARFGHVVNWGYRSLRDSIALQSTGGSSNCRVISSRNS